MIFRKSHRAAMEPAVGNSAALGGGEQQIFKAAVEAAPCGIFISDQEGVILMVNRAYERLTGYPAEALVGRRAFLSLHDPAELSRRLDAPHRNVDQHAEAAKAQALASRMAGSTTGPFEGSTVHEGDWIYLRYNNTPLAVRLSLSVLPIDAALHQAWRAAVPAATEADQRGRMPPSPAVDAGHWVYVGVASSAVDVADDPVRSDYLSRYDPVTRLPNQTLVQERMEHTIRRFERSGRQFAVLVIELDQLRNLQDSLGPSAVEIVLQIAAERLRGAVALEDALACIGATQFVVVLVDTQGEPESVAARLIERLGEPVECLGTAVSLTASAGLSIFPTDGTDAPLLMRRAIIALNTARLLGGGAVRHFSGEMQSHAARRLELEIMLREAIQEHQLSLAYQPQVNLDTGDIVLVESLLRWNHPLRGAIGPVEFIPVAEESGLILPIGEWVIHTACAQASAMLRKFGKAPRFAINVSPLQFQRQNVLEIVERALAAAALEPRYLEVEITESVLLGDTEQAMTTLHQLRKMGVEVAIDDFGTGYSSLSYLSRFEVDRLKIDRSFVRSMTTDKGSAAVVSAIIAMAHALGIRVTAEGVETREQAERLRELRCDEVQGYWFSRPLNARSLENLLAPIG